MSDTIKPGQWVRPLFVTDDAPMAGWRLLVDVRDTMWRWQKTLIFDDGTSFGVHVDNLSVWDRGQQLWETSETAPAGVLQ